MIDTSLERGLVSAAEAEQFRAMFERIEDGLGPDAPPGPTPEAPS
jgi:hypothetical protein